MALIIILGPAHPLRGGIAAFNERLAAQLHQEGHQVILYSFSLQYPSFLFPGKSQYTASPAPDGLDIRTRLNSVNPLNWLRTGREIRRLNPDMVITRFWLPFLAPSLGTVLRRIRRGGHARIVCIADNVIPHEKRPGDRALTAYFLRACDAFIAMSTIVLNELRRLSPKPAVLVAHPLYDQFGGPMSPGEARRKLGIPREGRLLLFFGFIRHYKGLDILLQAMADPRVRGLGVRLIVAGEFYESEGPYREMILQKGLGDAVILHSRFIADEKVSSYFSAADAVVLPYRSATQSGIAPLAYHFERPMLATRVGGLPETITEGKTGLLAEPNAPAVAAMIARFYELGPDHFSESLREEKKKYGWEVMARTVLSLGLDPQQR
jgi:glycosyltransferase involved in cell wall biosynthesis